jgi:NADPH-dependent 2,4-dienoyl-CoA reductase/sulfur reductase-like enzyme
VLAVGRITTPALAEQILVEGQADLIGLARAQIADPDFARKAVEGREDEIRPCVGTNYCISRLVSGQHVTCVHNAAAGREEELGLDTIRPAARPRRVLVAGGGPAGLEAARLAALRGHSVVLHERAPALGGQLLLASKVAARREMRGIVDYLSREVERLGVEVVLGSEVTPDLVRELEPDAVVVATGSRARTGGSLPGVPPIVSDRAISGRDVLADGAGPTLGSRILIVDFGGHIEGMSVADHLLDQGKEVELVTQHPLPGAKIGGPMWVRMMKEIPAKGLQVTAQSIVLGVEDDAVELVNVFSGSRSRREGIDTIVVIGDAASEDGLLGLLASSGVGAELVAVGDCVAPRYLESAILDGNRAGHSL